MLFSQLVKICQGKWVQKGEDRPITTLTIDSRQVSGVLEEVFFCLIGPHHNGHSYIQAAYQKGIRNFVVSQDIEILQVANVLRVGNALDALQTVAAYHRAEYDYPVIGITGSNGKTMIKEWLSTLLSEKYKVVKSPKSYNSQVGVPLSVWQMTSEHEIAVFEAGISQKGEMQNLSDIIRPSMGIFTNIGEAHSEGFDSIEEKIQEKSRLFDSCKQIICCQDHKNILEYLLKKYPKKVVTWSMNDSADIVIEKKGDKYGFHYNEGKIHLQIRLKEAQNLENIFHSITAAILNGLSQDQIEKGLKNIVPVPMRLELKKGINDTYLLDDTYNNDLGGLKIALDYLQQQAQFDRQTVILSDILQSGQDNLLMYQEMNQLLEAHHIERIIGIGPGLMKHEEVFSIEKSFFEDVESFLKSNTTFSQEMILVKGARAFGLEKIVSFLEEKNHGTVLEVNFESIIENLNIYRKRLKPNTKLMAMVKAFAYGGGIAEISNLLQYQKVDYLGVAYIDEGIYLRKRGIKIPVLVMNPDWNSLPLLQSFDLEAEVYSLPLLQKMVKEMDEYPAIQLKIETGMNRLGFTSQEVPDLIDFLSQHPQIKINGIFTHLSSSEEPHQDSYTKEQVLLFDRLYNSITERIGYKPLKHAVNSSGILRWPNYHFDMVRLGIGLYGFDSSGTSKLHTVSRLLSVVSQIKKVKKGDSIGYSRKGKVSKDGEIAIIPIGYADGYLRAFGNGNAYMSVNGKKAYTIGNICMDMTMLDVTGLNVEEGDPVIVFGESPSIADLAQWAQTIPYEILTNVSQRVKRVFRSE